MRSLGLNTILEKQTPVQSRQELVIDSFQPQVQKGRHLSPHAKTGIPSLL